MTPHHSKNRTQRSASRERLFLLLMILLPLFLLAGLELGLRLVGFGGDYPLFVDSATGHIPHRRTGWVLCSGLSLRPLGRTRRHARRPPRGYLP